MKKQVMAMLLAGVLLLSLCACVKKKEEATPTPDAEPTAVLTVAPSAEENILAIYQQALKRVLEEHIELDGYEYQDYEWESLGQIEFALCDADVDGEQELIIRHRDTYMAGQYTAVYRYDAERGELVSEGGGTASCLFYDNGTMLDAASHNQGWSGEFWPFTALRYDKTEKKYKEIAFVEAWDRALMEENRLPGYPEEVDVENAGFVYYIYEAGEDGADWGKEVAPVSQSGYDAWYEGIFGGAKEIEVDYQPLTAANVGNLYYENNVKAKVDVNHVIAEGFFGELQDRLTERQKKLLEDLPMNQLPREAAGEEEFWTQEDIWESTLLPMCYDENSDVTLYAVVVENSIAGFAEGGYLDGAGIVLRVGDQTKYYPIVHDQFWCGGNPMMAVDDFNGDGKDEAAVSFLSGHGTGFSVHMLYIFDLETLTCETVDLSGIDIDVSYNEDTQTVVLTSGAETATVKLDDAYLREDQGFTGVYAGNVIFYSYENGKLWCQLGLDFSGWAASYLASATGEVIYENGKYTLGPLKLDAD